MLLSRGLRWHGVDDGHGSSRRDTERGDFVHDAGVVRRRGIEKDRVLTELLNLLGCERGPPSVDLFQPLEAHRQRGFLVGEFIETHTGGWFGEILRHMMEPKEGVRRRYPLFAGEVDDRACERYRAQIVGRQLGREGAQKSVS